MKQFHIPDEVVHPAIKHHDLATGQCKLSLHVWWRDHAVVPSTKHAVTRHLNLHCETGTREITVNGLYFGRHNMLSYDCFIVPNTRIYLCNKNKYLYTCRSHIK